MAPEALRWLAIAGQDLKAVRNNIQGPEPALDIAAYHCQQAAEKIVKAALITRGIDPPRWHDIDSLLTLLGAKDPLTASLAPLAIPQFFFFSEEWACGSRIPLFGQAGFEGWVGLSMLRVA